MKSKKLIVIILAIILAGGGIYYLAHGKKSKDRAFTEVWPKHGLIYVEILETGEIQPRNRLEIKPPVSGRVESILVNESDRVKKGQIIAWLSSTERAALLDAARAKGQEEYKKWEDVYKPTPIIAPLDGFIIVRRVEPGQSITSSDPVLVMADTLIINAQVDETDLRYIYLNQSVSILLDAYPDIKIPGHVEHIDYESQVINNVTVYNVRILPNRLLPSFRSGMTANVEIKANRKENALLLPIAALQDNKGSKFVYVKEKGKKEPARRDVKVGLSNVKNVEIISGITEDDAIMIPAKTSGSSGIKTRTGGFGGGLPGMPSSGAQRR
jgi:macrolide-specific efflux system membrane fusion protein